MSNQQTANYLSTAWEAPPVPLEELPRGLIGDEI